MCGIVAMLSLDGPLPPGQARRATDALAHRGPDGRGLWASADGRVALGHTRLSMVDPLADQPLASEESDLHLVVNGEFYDFERIQRELRGRGHRLRTRSDSEIALHLYQEQGTGCLRDLRGEFSFALWDEPRGTLFAARDRFGIKPLFYAQLGPVLYVASEVKALLAAGVPAAWDEEAAHDALHLAFDASRSLFRGIRQLPPAHLLVAGPAGVRLERYWDIPYPTQAEAAASTAALERRGAVEEAIEHTRSLLDEAVALRLRADVPVGCLLSGGVDSSAVLGIAARHTSRPVAAFTIGFNQAAYDERDVARATTASAGGAFHLLPLGDRELADAFPDAVRAGEMLQFNAHGTARFLLSREISRAGYKTVLAGEGGDELFAGYAFLRASMPALAGGDGASGALVGSASGSFAGAIGSLTGRLPAPLAFGLRLLRPPTAAQRELATVSPWLARVARGLGLRGPAVDTLVTRLSVARGVLAPEFVGRFREHDPYRDLYRSLDARGSLRAWEPARAMLYLWLRTLFASYHLAADRLDMAHAVEVRMPFLDHVLWEHVCRYPVSLLAKDGQNKYLLREAVRPSIPDAVYQRTKQPFLAPPAAATPGNPLHDFAQDTLRGSSLAFVDRAAVVRLLDGLPSRRPSELQALEALLMALVSLTILDRAYFTAGERQ
jgi:asparagine synthase (glutamine-hydrolysing)